LKSLLASARRFYQDGLFDKAEAACRRALRLEPRHPEAIGLLGVLLAQQGNLDAALDLLSRAVAVEPTNAALHQNLAKALFASGRDEEGIEHYAIAATRDPACGPVHYDLGTALLRKDRFEEAEECFRRALQLMPDFVPALNNLGSTFCRLYRRDEAISCYLRALELEPRLVEARVSLGICLRELGRLEDAIVHFRRVLALDPAHAEAHVNLAFCHLLRQDFATGWQEYEWRQGMPCARHPGLDLQCWGGGDLSGRAILVCAEQGIGDELMFASCLPELGIMAGRVVLECDPRLAPIFKRSFPDFFVRGSRQDAPFDWLHEAGPVDAQVMTGSLPRHLRPTLARFLRHTGYLVADPSATSRWRERFATLGDTLKVGIAWRGGGTPFGAAARSIALDGWAPILSVEGASFINLQHGECADEIEENRSRTGIAIRDWPDSDPLTNLDDFAAKVAALDLVIAVDNSTVHLAGALGVPVWVLLGQVPDWRWSLARDDSPWYPSVRLFRQDKAGGWEKVTQRIAQDLQGMVKAKAARWR
jgi:Flp pilus assembly protein TadD